MAATRSTAPGGPEPGPRDLRLYLANRFLGTMATQFQVVAVGWQVYHITNDPFALGYVGLFEFLPMVLLALPAGDLADRVDRRRVLMATYALQTVASGFLLLLTWNDIQVIWPFYLVVTLFGVARGFSNPASQSVLPFLVSIEQLPNAIAYRSSVNTVANVSGPAIGGAILALLGAGATYGACVLLFVVTMATIWQLRMRHPAQMGRGTESAYRRIADGIAFTWRQPIVMGAISLDLFAVLFGGAVALLPIYQRDILHVGPAGLGMLRSAPAVGAALVAFALARRPLTRHTGTWMFASVAVFGIATVVFGLSKNFNLSLAVLAVIGGADMVSVFVRSALVQLATPDHLRGRVGSVNSLFISASNELGQFESGITAGWFGTVPAVVIGGIGTLAVVGIWMTLFPPLRRVDRFSEVVPDETAAAASVSASAS